MILRTLSTLVLLLLEVTFVTYVHPAETLRVAYPSLGPGSTPCWVTTEAGIWRKYGLDVEPILLSGGARTVPALLGGSVQMVLGSDVAVAAEDPRAKQLGEQAHWDLSLIDEIRQSGFLDQLYRN